MKFLWSFKHLVGVLFLALVLTIGSAAYVAISNIVAEQSRLQQQSISPVFSLVELEVLMPLHVAQTLAHGHMFHPLIAPEVLDEDYIYQRLGNLEKRFNLEFFVASEKHRKQYFSEGASIDLIEGEIEWYYRIKAIPKDLIADVGDRDDPKLFFDLKIYDEENNYIGIVGVGKHLQYFLKQFSNYKDKYGYDFLFVDDKQQIVLASDPVYAPVEDNLKTLADLVWYNDIDFSTLTDNSLNGVLVSYADEDFLISELYIEELDWRLLLMLPLKARQAELSKTFLTNAVMITLLVSVMFLITYSIANKYRSVMVTKISRDSLTKLLNREAITEKFDEIKHSPHPKVCLILLDIDFFKKVNDTYGHNTGDDVLKFVASVLGKVVRDQDYLSRWGGEEFLMLLPDTDLIDGAQVSERARSMLEAARFKTKQGTINITASFGVTCADASVGLENMLEDADKALYRAKRQGRNKVEIFSE